MVNCLCQVCWGPWAEGYKGWLREGPAQPPRAPASDLLAAVNTLEMKTVLLTIGLSLVAVLQAQDPPASEKDTPDVRLGGRVGWRGLGEGRDVLGSGSNPCP